mgnify:FL=1|tara:strand:+ start:1605 stop:3410 length:1806 start_codon:yes stop_codon:yes gene_type:complete
MKLTNEQVSSYESEFSTMESLAIEQQKAAVKLKLVDSTEAAALMADALKLAGNASKGRAILKKNQISYTPEETTAKDIIVPLLYSNKAVNEQAVENFQQTNKELADKGSFVSVPTLPLAKAGTEGTYAETKAWGPDEWLAKQVGRTVVPFMDNTFRNFAKATGQVLSNVIPDEQETYIVETMKGAHYDISRQDWYNKVTGWLEAGTIEPYIAWKKKNPTRAELAEDVMSTTGMVLDRTNMSAVARRSGTRIALSGAQGAKLKRRLFIQDLLAPDKPDSVNNPNKWSANDRGEPIFVPDQSEQMAIHETTLIPNLNPSAPAPASKKLIVEQREKLSNQLNKVIIDAGNPRYSPDHLNSTIAAHVDDLVEGTDFRAASGSTSGVPALIEHMGTMVGKSNHDALGLLELRREFDDWIKNNVQLSDLSPDAKTSLERVVKNVRNTLNSELDAIVPNAPTKRLRSRVSSLYTAEQMIAPKADAQVKGLFARLNDGYYVEKLGMKLPTTATGLYFTGALGAGVASTTFGIPALGAIAGVYGLKKTADIMTNPTIRRKAGNTIVALSKAMKKVTDPIEIAIMRGDRAMLLQLLSESVATGQEETEEGN